MKGLRLLYISDIPVELCFAGPTLMYRLLEDHPGDSVMVIQGMEIKPEFRLPGVTYVVQKSGLVERLRVSRFASMLGFFVILQEWLFLRKLKRTMADFRPDLILTVPFRLKWLQAYWASRKYQIPLHCILHDDWLTTERYGVLQPYLTKQFSEMYRHSKGRYCISANMEAHYFTLLGVHGHLLHPTRGKFDKMLPPRTVRTMEHPVRFCYAGTLYTSDFLPLLDRVAGVLATYKAELHLFTNETRADVSGHANLQLPNIIFHGMLPPDKLRTKMNEDLDVAILINSFEIEAQFRYNFSSKLVDYSTAGMPVLMWGPVSSGAISWARQAGYSAIVSENSDVALEALVVSMLDPTARSGWAWKMHELGKTQFDYAANHAVFYKTIAEDPQS